MANGRATGMHSVTHGVTHRLTPSWPSLAWSAGIWENIYSFWNFLPSVIMLIDGLIVVAEKFFDAYTSCMYIYSIGGC